MLCYIFTDSWAVAQGLGTWMPEWEKDQWKFYDKDLWGANIWKDIWEIAKTTNLSAFHVGAHAKKTSVEREYNADVDCLAAIAEVECSTPISDETLTLARWIHHKTGHAGSAAMHRWAPDREIGVPLSDLKTVKEQCTTCQLDEHRPLPKIITGELLQGKAPAQIWQIDYIGPLPLSKRCKYICTCVDMYSGVLVACAYKRATQNYTIKTLDIIALYYVIPLQIQSDNGSHFKGLPSQCSSPLC